MNSMRPQLDLSISQIGSLHGRNGRSGRTCPALDSFDLKLLNLVQRDDAQTAEALSREVPLSPSAISRRLRRLRADGLISQSIALLGPGLTEGRLRAFLFIELYEHTDLDRMRGLKVSLLQAPCVQFCYEMAGAHDFIAMLDCASMTEINATIEELLASNSLVKRFQTHFIRGEVKFQPFIDLLR